MDHYYKVHGYSLDYRTKEGQRQQAPPSSVIANPTVPNATVNTTNVSLSSESTPTSIDKLSHGEELQYENFSQVFPCGLEVLSQPNVLDPSIPQRFAQKLPNLIWVLAKLTLYKEKREHMWDHYKNFNLF